MLRTYTITNTQAGLVPYLTIIWNEIDCKIIYTYIVVCVGMNLKSFKKQAEIINLN